MDLFKWTKYTVNSISKNAENESRSVETDATSLAMNKFKFKSFHMVFQIILTHPPTLQHTESRNKLDARTAERHP